MAPPPSSISPSLKFTDEIERKVEVEVEAEPLLKYSPKQVISEKQINIHTSAEVETESTDSKSTTFSSTYTQPETMLTSVSESEDNFPVSASATAAAERLLAKESSYGSFTGYLDSSPSDNYLKGQHENENEGLRYRNQCLSMVSIAQGGLKRIRRDARTSHVTLMDVVEMFGVAICEITQYNDQEIARKGWESNSDSLVGVFNSKQPSVSVPSYLWNIVLSLNRHADPSFFATDGSALSLSDSKSSLDSTNNNNNNNRSNNNNENGEPRPSTPESLEQSEDDSAMGRGLRCLLLALVYIDRIGVKHPERFLVTSKSIHKLLLTAIYVAAKFTDDSLPHPHRFFAKIGGVTHRKLKALENAFCKLIDFDFHVTDVEFQALCMEQLRWAVRGARTRNSIRKANKSARLRNLALKKNTS
uniref:Cyclin N-terminal domain-containing protein n=1 Tax=Aplanochytrium stocchinoi TaxID=215587 RepID=A0A6S8G1D8_9STRA|mmetsp:Transcript_35446/g.43777  ORF Transcript_35446/g.43777 Transcript_35446/m.43777 type:complete len:417 (+) Transcript_35446:610-1860(+)|eukprot:CAMPEP_0204826430 /NCGR_PEP_ID=MMETSP1346-20131115/4119_1 /ASSEMBLY_ACC=CAM_ASM_000771 /TAXON_ID=215587 /ORGANISM="Aplanochytrium stocchinoi, Strain GSBS06" /LENGTH=416 /DNA_ID=CAMNT_0051954461 /DNA_START=564 /DNA_END=1817 /DNA_ORIENTATION=+